MVLGRGKLIFMFLVEVSGFKIFLKKLLTFLKCSQKINSRMENCRTYAGNYYGSWYWFYQQARLRAFLQ
jgi:hypothetical protein